MKACDFFLNYFTFKKVKHVQEVKKEHEEIESVCLVFQIQCYHGE